MILNKVDFERYTPTPEPRSTCHDTHGKGDESLKTCDYCHSKIVKHRPNQRFCPNGGKCRDAWHKEHSKAKGIEGKVEYVRRLAKGRMSVTIRFSKEQAARIRVSPGDRAALVEFIE